MSNQDENALKLWEVLTVSSKTKERIITYGEASRKVGIHHRVLRFSLGKVQQYCFETKLPPLTILVVNKATMRPGEGFTAWDIDDIDAGIAKVAEYNWEQISNPFEYARHGLTLEDVVEAIFEDPQKAGEMFALVKVRGIAQVIFRNLLLQTYEEECAFCGLSFPEALQASHIVPWSVSSASQRLDPSNGVLLCSTHHRLFDYGYLTIGSDGKINYCDPTETSLPPYCPADRAATVHLHGNNARLPKKSEHRPSDAALHYHRAKVFQKRTKN